SRFRQVVLHDRSGALRRRWQVGDLVRHNSTAKGDPQMEQTVQTDAKPIKIPGPNHPISIERNTARVVVSVAGRVIADTRDALTLSEAHYPAVDYIPRKDVDMTLLARS